MSGRRTLTVPETAAVLGVSPWSLYAAVKAGESPVPPIRVGRRILFSRQAVSALLGPLDEPPVPTPEPVRPDGEIPC